MNRLDQFEAMERKATAAPWTQQHYSVYQGMDVLFRVDHGELNSTLHDAKLIAAARNLAPHFIRLARAAMELCSEAANAIVDYGEDHDLRDLTKSEAACRAALALLLAEVPDA